MAAKTKKQSKTDLEVGQALKDYIEICKDPNTGLSNPVKANLLKQKFTDQEILLFVYEIKSQKDALDTENLFDISILEQLSDLHVQMNRIMTLQKELLDTAELMKNSEQPGEAEQATNVKIETAKLTSKWGECNDRCKALIGTLNQERQQRAKQNMEQRISFTKIIKDLDDIKYKERIGKHGSLLEKSKNKKKKQMMEQGLIMIAENKSDIKEELTDENSTPNILSDITIETQEKIQQEETEAAKT